MPAVAERAGAGTSAGRLAGLRALTVAQKLLVTDELWTGELIRVRQSGVVSDEDLAVFEELGQELHSDLAAIRPLSTELRLMLNDDLTDENVDDALRALVEAEPSLEVASRWLDGESLPDYSFRGAAIAACEYVEAEAPQESNEIQIKLSELRERRVPPADLPQRLRCSLIAVAAAGALVGAIAGAGAAVVTGVGGAGLVLAYVGAGAVSVSALATGVLCWVEAKCPSVLAAIGRFRR